MKTISFALLCCLLSLTTLAQGSKPLELKDVTSGQFRVENIQGVVPMPDGEAYTMMNAQGTQIIKYSFQTGKEVEVLFDVNTARECTFKRFDSYQFSPDGQKLLIATKTTPIYRRSYTAVHYIYPLKRNDKGVTTNNIIEKLSDGGPQQVPVFSPDGTMVAFVRDNNIFLVKLLYGNAESQVTEDGKPNAILNGIPDWVYEEEFSFNRALEFSADNTLLAFIRFDETDVPSYSFPLFAGEAPR
ncbi:MAG: DPP IV N-terminal domain-containing protein, partial [Mediterranea sp.]|nr:DPP IV N-terminal domain-containing protein [Mediterranea sp.]